MIGLELSVTEEFVLFVVGMLGVLSWYGTVGYRLWMRYMVDTGLVMEDYWAGAILEKFSYTEIWWLMNI